MPDLIPPSPEAITAFFTHRSTESPKGFRCARWARPIAPVVFGVDDASLSLLKAAITRTVALTGHSIAETDPELGVNFLWFFGKDWQEIGALEGLTDLIPQFSSRIEALKASNASHYRYQAHDAKGGIKMTTLLLNMSGPLGKQSIDEIGVGQTLLSLLSWQNAAFKEQTPLGVGKESGMVIVKPPVAALVRAAYDPALPVASDDPAHAYRLYARSAAALSAG